MFDLFLRALRHPLDYLPVIRVTDLSLQEKVSAADHTTAFTFAARRLPSWKAGQHAIFTLPGQKVTGKSWRAFSVASASVEGVIKIGTMIVEEPSSFKQHLSVTNEVRMHGPFGEMYVRPHMRNIVAVAGGIGITPFRAIISDLTAKQSPVELTLIYSDSDGYYAFKDDLEKWRSANPRLKVIYVSKPEEVNTELTAQVAAAGNNAYYFLSGSPGMITAIHKSLRDQNIKNSHIFNDPFKGY